MKLEIFAVRDRATDQYGTPMFLVTSGQAIRSFSDEVNRKENGTERNMLAEHPEDYDLYLLGSYETNTGTFNCETPRQIAIGKDLRVRPGLGPVTA